MYALNDTFPIDIQAYDLDTGADAAADSAPTWGIYKNAVTTAILTGTASLYDSTGFYSTATTLSVANGFAVGGGYRVRKTFICNQLTRSEVESFTIRNDVSTTNVQTYAAAAVAADKTGFSLGASGLDAIATTVATTVATTFPEMVTQTWRRLYKKATMTTTHIKTYADDGTTVITTQAVSDDGTTQTQGAAS